MTLTDKQIQRFWSKVNIKDNGCWEWTGALVKGYGSVDFGGKKYRANRIAWMLANGRMPLAHLDICHSCDNPKCCNPKHLWEGTRKQNMRDASNKGRIKSGKEKLTLTQALEIRKAEGKQADIAQRYGVSHTTVYRIKANTIWRTLDVRNLGDYSKVTEGDLRTI